MSCPSADGPYSGKGPPKQAGGGVFKVIDASQGSDTTVLVGREESGLDSSRAYQGPGQHRGGLAKPPSDLPGRVVPQQISIPGSYGALREPGGGPVCLTPQHSATTVFLPVSSPRGRGNG